MLFKKQGLLIRSLRIVEEKSSVTKVFETWFTWCPRKPQKVLALAPPGNSELKDRACCVQPCSRAHRRDESTRQVEIEVNSYRSFPGSRTRGLMIRAPSPVPRLDRPKRFRDHWSAATMCCLDFSEPPTSVSKFSKPELQV